MRSGVVRDDPRGRPLVRVDAATLTARASTSPTTSMLRIWITLCGVCVPTRTPSNTRAVPSASDAEKVQLLYTYAWAHSAAASDCGCVEA